MTHTATFFLSTGRCGTQWLVKQLTAIYGDLVTVRHEPIFLHYQPKSMLEHQDPGRLPDASRFLDHVERIESALAVRPYVECGWPCYGAIPYLTQRFEGRVRIVHLMRHPVDTARSLVTHRWYQRPPMVKEIADQGELSPFDRGTLFHDYRTRWATLSSYEKCLYFWAEVNGLGLGLEEKAQYPWLRLRYEDLFAGPGLERLLAFLDLPRRPPIFAQLGVRHDKIRLVPTEEGGPDVLAHHPQVMDVATQLGYDLFEAMPETAPRGTLSRNAPCPCGSGRRYKHCHGREA